MNYTTTESSIDIDLIRNILEGLVLTVTYGLSDVGDCDDTNHKYVIKTLNMLVDKFSKEENE